MMLNLAPGRAGLLTAAATTTALSWRATIPGIAPTEELVAELAKAAGRISSQLCGGSTLDTIKQTIRQAAGAGPCK